jgi:16S rRNA (guanine966-N2)-methyltransferase
MLSSRLGSFEDLRVADLYAGSGALGLEALSRGAASAVFVDSDPRAAAAIRANAEALGATEQVQILSRAADALPPRRPFDLLFADPPYSKGSGTAALAAMSAAYWIGPGSWMAIETQRGDSVDPGKCSLAAEREIGRALLTLLRG